MSQSQLSIRIMRGHDVELLADRGMAGGEEVGVEIMVEMGEMTEMDMKEMQETMVVEMEMEER